MVALIAALVVSGFPAFAQPTDCRYTYFDDGAISTSWCLDPESRRGTARAFDRAGTVIGEWPLSSSSLIAGVRFSFHADGSLRRADFSQHPDGGIQWYREIATYDRSGRRIAVWEDGYDLRRAIVVPAEPGR